EEGCMRYASLEKKSPTDQDVIVNKEKKAPKTKRRRRKEEKEKVRKLWQGGGGEVGHVYRSNFSPYYRTTLVRCRSQGSKDFSPSIVWAATRREKKDPGKTGTVEGQEGSPLPPQAATS